MARNRYLLPLLLAAALLLPAAAVAESTPASLGENGVVYPRNSPEAHKVHSSDNAFPMWGMLGVIAVLAGAGFYLLKRGQLGTRAGVSVHQRLAIEETRPLGNKQFLAVAAYGERKLLLAVCPGRVDFLCRLDDGPAAPVSAEPARREAPLGQG
jgi:flagellar protein FliO/FliZ